MKKLLSNQDVAPSFEGKYQKRKDQGRQNLKLFHHETII